MIEQELENVLQKRRQVATLLTQIEVDPRDPAFQNPTKPIGPVYSRSRRREERPPHSAGSSSPMGTTIAASCRRQSRNTFRTSVSDPHSDRSWGDRDMCQQGRNPPPSAAPNGGIIGVEAVIDKDRASALLAAGTRRGLPAPPDRGQTRYMTAGAHLHKKPIRKASPEQLPIQIRFCAEGSIGTKESRRRAEFVKPQAGSAGIGSLRTRCHHPRDGWNIDQTGWQASNPTSRSSR